MTALRGEPEKKHLMLMGDKKFQIIEIGFIVFTSIVLFSLSIYFKKLIGEKIFALIGQSFDYTFTNTEGETITWYLEGYSDAFTYYKDYLIAFREGWNPYGRYEGSLDYYLYGPLLIYGRYIVSIFIGLFNPGISPEEMSFLSIKWSSLIFDSLAVVVLYLIIINLKVLKYKYSLKHLAGVVFSIGYIFMPMNLYYIDTIFLNGSLMTLFALIAFLFFLKEKYRLAAVFLGFAWLSKQMPLFLIIPFFSLLWKKYDLKKAFSQFLYPFLLTSFIISIPWIFLTPLLYIGRILVPGRPQYQFFNLPEFNQVAITLANSILTTGCIICADIYFILNIVMIPFIIFYGGSLFLAHFNAKKIMENENNLIFYTTWSILICHVFLSRGIYKYYDIYIMPFLLLSFLSLVFIFGKKLREFFDSKIAIPFSKEKKRQLFLNSIYIITLIISILTSIAFIYGLNILIMYKIRYLHPFYLFLVFLLVSTFIRLDFYRELFKKKNYLEFKQDFKDFFVYIKNDLVKVYHSFVGLFKKKKKEKKET